MICTYNIKGLLFAAALFLVYSCTDHMELAQEHTYNDISYVNCDEVLENTLPVIDELKSQVNFLEGTIANISDEQLSTLGNYLGQATYVGLGEATHGSTEFFSMKTRIIQYLAKFHNFKAVAFEGSWAEGARINRYIEDGEGSIEEIVKNLPTRAWRSQEIVDLVEWIREFNLEHPDQQAFSFFGIDLAVTQAEFTMITDYLLINSTELYDLLDSLVTPISAKITEDQLLQNILNQDEKELLIENLQDVAVQFETNKDQLISSSSVDKYKLIRQTFNIIIQAASYVRNDLGNNRDAYMSQNAEWLSAFLGGAKIAIWAHNVHVSKDRALWIGGQLKQRHGNNYRAVGSSFSSGTFWAYNRLEGSNMGELKEVGCASINALFEKVGEMFYLIHEDLIGNSISRTHLAQYQPFYMVSSTFNPQQTQSQLAQSQILASYDVMIHFNSVTYSNLIF